MYKIIIHSHSGNSWIRWFVVLIMKYILISNFLVVCAYNIDTNFPMFYPNNATNAHQYLHTNFSRSYFGYSVLLYRNSQKNTTWLLVGAPRGNYTQSVRNPLLRLNEPGAAYSCSLPGSCVEIEPDVIEDQEIFLQQLNRHGHVWKKHSWFGGAMSIDRNSGFLTICAPRTIMSIILNRYTYIDTLQGMCYSGLMPSTTLNAEISDILNYDFSKKTWYDPMHGFSVSFAPSQDGRTINRIIGTPNDEITGTVTMERISRYTFLKDHQKITDMPTRDDLSQFGYSVTSGYYFNRTRFLYASSDPGWDYVGQVAVIDPHENIRLVTSLQGSNIGEFFGASLATGDLDKDGLHDLVIGAPHWGNDNGRVYIYLSSLKEKFKLAATLEGASEDAQFGYALASGDLDNDGFSDIIVGAPWQESGAIYVFNGDANLKNEVKPALSQKIMMQSSNYNLPKLNIETFGFSISEPIDIDNNGYADIAVGAYKSGHVILLRSRPIVKTNLTIHLTPNTLQRNMSDFSIKVCIDYRGYDAARTYAFKVSLTIDTKYKRTKQTLLELFSMDPPLGTCVTTNVSLADNIQNFIEPIIIFALHNFTHNSFARDFCKTCPMENKGGNNAEVLLPFDIECGEDKVCNSNILVAVKFLGVRDNDSWVIGSNDITLETNLTNHGELAYLTKIVFTLPHDIMLSSILPSCEEHTNGSTLVVTCDVGNPLGTNEQKIIKLDLDMRHLTNGSLHGHILKFLIEIQTRSVNHGTRMIKSSLVLQSEASLLLNGKAVEEKYYLPDLDKEHLNISFQHIYQILKFGATPIEAAQLFVNVPTTVNNLDYLVYLYKPRIYISGQYHDCMSNGINVLDAENKLQEKISDIFDWNEYKINNNKTLRAAQNMTNSLSKRNINGHTRILSYVIQKLYSMKTVKSEKLNNNLTQDVIYLNCSTYNVNCSTIYCDLSALKRQQDVGKLVIKLILNVTKLRDIIGISDQVKIVKFSTETYVQITQPANKIISIDSRHGINLTTEFHSTAKMQELEIWIVPVSVSLGLILLCIVIIILSMVGFFKRTKKEELSALKTNEIKEEQEI